MRHLLTGAWNVQSNGIEILQPVYQRVSLALAIAGILCLSVAFGDDSVVKGPKSTNKEAEVSAQPKTETCEIPACLEKLKLSEKQQDQIKNLIREYDGSISSVWKQFSQRYMQTIALESSLLAAIEDNLTEPQRLRVRELRRKTAQHEKTIAATNDTPNQATSKPADAVQDELAGVGVSLTAEQEAMAEKVEEKYRAHLRSLNRDIQGLHSRLLSLEADKLVAIEKVLTKDQLTQLRTNRQSAPDMAKVANSNHESKKAE